MDADKLSSATTILIDAIEQANPDETELDANARGLLDELLRKPTDNPLPEEYWRRFFGSAVGRIEQPESRALTRKCFEEVTDTFKNEAGLSRYDSERLAVRLILPALFQHLNHLAAIAAEDLGNGC